MTTPKTYAQGVKTLIPSARAEGWRYADLSLIRGRELPLAGEEASSKIPEPITGWPVIVIANGSYGRPMAASHG